LENLSLTENKLLYSSSVDSGVYNDMSLLPGTVLVTGGAGFIGSHIVDNLISKGVKVKVLDNLSGGNISYITKHFNNKNFRFLHKDLHDADGRKEALEDVKTVFHMAAYPEVKTGFEYPQIPYDENIRNTFHILEQIRKSKVETILFASSSTVYGEPERIPTPEDYGPLRPISPYGASKLACEALLSSYCHTYGINGQILRLANVVGSRSRHGVIWDFINKLSNNNSQLQILGNGLQSKSYVYVGDCVGCFFFCLRMLDKRRVEIFNIGSEDTLDVISIAKIVCNTMKLQNVELVTQQSVSGWIGDVKQMQLEVSKLEKLGWKPQFSSMSAVTLACTELVSEYEEIISSKKHEEVISSTISQAR
jgi:UDP-glucose 4-epimerase